MSAILHLDASQDTLKMLRETLCLAQTALGWATPGGASLDTHRDRLGRVIAEIDRQRPLGPDGKHGDRHTPTCGCEVLVPDTGPSEFLIWSHHHNMWFAPKGCGYRRDITDAGRFALNDTRQWLGRGCYCCAVPEVVIPAPGSEVFAQPGRVGEWATKQIERATNARFDAGDINKHALNARVTVVEVQSDDAETEPVQ